MSAISKFAEAQRVYNEKMDMAVKGLQGDIKFLNDEISKFQNSPGEVSAEDQASLDLLEARARDISSNLDALDSITPPLPPVNG